MREKVNSREIAAEYRLNHWAQIMQERSESGMSIKAYCEIHRLRAYGSCSSALMYLPG